MREGEESNAINQSKQTRIVLGMDGNNDMRKNTNAMTSPDEGESDQPSLIQYRSKRRCVMEREKKKKKEWWEEENVLSDEEDFEDIDSDGSDGQKKRRKKGVMPMTMLPPPPNRIFVFSTDLANRAAEAVIQGRVPSIVAYHRAQPQNHNLLRKTPEYAMNHAGMGNPYRYGNYTMPKMEGMFPGGKPEMLESQGRVPLAAMGSGFNSMQQYQQYLKQQQQQQQQQHEPRTTMAGVDELQQMLFGPANGSPGAKAMLPPSSAEGQGVPPRPTYTYPPGFRPQQMAMGDQREERFKFLQQQPSQQQGYASNPSSQQQQQQQQQAQLQQQSQQQQSFSPSPSASTAGPTGQQSHLPPVLSPSSSASSSSPLSSTIRSPPPYPNSRAAEGNTLPGASAVVGAPSPTNVSSPQTPHGPLTPRLVTSLASPKDGQRPPFSPGAGPPASASFTSQTQTQVAAQQQNIPESAPPGMKQLPLARQSPSLEKAEHPGEKSSGASSYPMMSDSRVNFPSARQEGTQRPNSLDLSRDNQEALAPPNRSPFHPGTSPMSHHQMSTSSPSAHHSSKSFSVESLTAPTSDKARYYRAPPMQAASPYAAYTQQPGLFYPGQKFPQAMLSQGQYQFPPHMQSAPQQFFPPNLPPNMYIPRNSFPIHHAGNREGGL